MRRRRFDRAGYPYITRPDSRRPPRYYTRCPTMRRAAPTTVAVERAYSLWRWLDPHVTRFHAHAHATSGRVILAATVDMMDQPQPALYAPVGSAM